MKKRILSIVLSLVIVLSVLTVGGVTFSQAEMTFTAVNKNTTDLPTLADDVLHLGTTDGFVSAGNFEGGTTNTDVTTLQDGAIWGDGGVMLVPGKNLAYITYDMGQKYDFKKILVAGRKKSVFADFGVYIGGESKKASNVMVSGAAADYTYGSAIGYVNWGSGAVGGSTETQNQTGLLLELPEGVSGRYITFVFKGYDIWGAWRSWISEIYATGTVSANQEDDNDDEAGSDRLFTPVGSSSAGLPTLADDVLHLGTTDGFVSAGNFEGGTTNTDVTTLQDGAIWGDAGVMLVPGKNLAYITYDMGQKYDFKKILVAGRKKSVFADFGVYIGGESKKASNVMVSGAAADYTYGSAIGYVNWGSGAVGGSTETQNQTGLLLELPEGVSGRYITFVFKGYEIWGAWRSWISEIYATGTVSANQEDDDDDEADSAVGSFVGITANHSGLPSMENNLLKNATADAIQDSAGTVKGDDGGLTADENALFYDDKMFEGHWVHCGGDGYVYFTYDLGAFYMLEKVLYAANGAHGADSFEVYVGKKLKQASKVSPDYVYGRTIASAPDFATATDPNDGNKGVMLTFPENTEARFITFRLKGFKVSWGGYRAWIGSLLLTGTMSTNQPEVPEDPDNLVKGMTPFYSAEVPARGIDNKTAVDVNGNPGVGNTGTFTSSKNLKSPSDCPIENLTDGDYSTKGTVEVTGTGSPTVLHYNTPWAVLVYRFNGYSKMEDITLTCTDEASYYVSGIQYYASVNFADLFKNESLLYTTGGEKYLLDEENSTEDVPVYIPDESTDSNRQRHHYYQLSSEEQQKEYRYVALVITRPYGVRSPISGSELVGWDLARIVEFEVNGSVVREEEPRQQTYTCMTSVGEVTVNIGALDYDEREFFDNVLGGVKVTETKLPASVNRHISDNWMSVDNETVFTFQLVDKDGNPIPETHEDIARGMNGREIELFLPSTAEYMQSMAVLENGELRRLYNSFTDITRGNKVVAGCLNYAKYDELTANNRSKAVINSASVSLVYMKLNGIDDKYELNNNIKYETLMDFMNNETVAGVSTESTEKAENWHWFILLALLSGAIVSVVGCCVYKTRRADR